MQTSTTKVQPKKPYRAPALVKYGQAVQLTLGSGNISLESIFGNYRGTMSGCGPGCSRCGTCV